MGFFDWLPCCGPRVKDDEDQKSPADETTHLVQPSGRPSSQYSATDGGYGAAGEGGGSGSNHETLTKEQRARIEAIGRAAGSQMLSIHRPSPRHARGGPTSASASRERTTSTTSNPSHPGFVGTGSIRTLSQSTTASPTHPSAAGPAPYASSRTSNLPKTDTITSASALTDAHGTISSASSSRPSSPSPDRPDTSPPGGTMGAMGTVRGQESVLLPGQRGGGARGGSGSAGLGEGEGEGDEEGEREGAAGDGEGEGEVVRKQVFLGGGMGGGGRARGARGRGRGRGRGGGGGGGGAKR